MTEATDDRLAEYYLRVLAIIEEHGWMVQGVLADAPGVMPFAYTVGLSRLDLPDLYVFGMPAGMAQDILNGTARLMVEGQRFTSGDVVDLDYSVQFKIRGPVSLEQAQAKLARNVAPPDRPATLWQILWPDTEGRFPDEDDYDVGRYPQQVIDEESGNGEHDGQEVRTGQEAHGEP